MSRYDAKTEADKLMISKGFIIAGGMWGQAYWKRDGNKVISVYNPDTAWTHDKIDQKAEVFFYTGPFYDGYELEDGEAPSDDIESFTFKNLEKALIFLDLDGSNS